MALSSYGDYYTTGVACTHCKLVTFTIILKTNKKENTASKLRTYKNAKYCSWFPSKYPIP